MFRKKPDEQKSSQAPSPESETGQERRKGFFRRLRERLNKGESWLTYDLAHLMPGGKPNEDFLEEMETRLLSGDVGVEATTRIMDGLDKKLWRDELKDAGSVIDTIRSSMQDILGLGEKDRMNLPATLQGNWRWRLKHEQLTPAVKKKLAELTEIYGRKQPAG